MNQELKNRKSNIRNLFDEYGIDAVLLTCNMSLLYVSGRIISGYIYLSRDADLMFVKRPNNINGQGIFNIRKPEQIPDILKDAGIPMPATLALEGDELTFREYNRLAACFPDTRILPVATQIIHKVRTIKSNLELDIFRRTGLAHTKAYNRIPSLFRPGMTDVGLSIEIERAMRQEGMLGQIRIFGQSMELFMGSLLAGDNAAAPSPYDFALGGAGTDVSLPVGANGTPLLEGHSLMVDIGGNLNGYLSDMSRAYSVGPLPDYAYAAHEACLAVQKAFEENARPGAIAEDLYHMALEIVSKAGFADYFMGTIQKAGFIGHGIGLELNEQPVFAPRSKTRLESGMVFALEPKIVLPNVGPVGIENSWIVNPDNLERITLCPDNIIDLSKK